MPNENKPWIVIKELLAKDKKDDQSISKVNEFNKAKDRKDDQSISKVIQVDEKEITNKNTIANEFNSILNQLGVKLG